MTGNAVKRIGLIPAHAGKTPSTGACRGRWRGSSPLTRGKPFWGSGSTPSARLIPAHAGKTMFTKNVLSVPVGSSPLTRGKRLGGRPLLLLLGLIPAHAGKTARAERIHAETTAHPRSRGENETSAPLWEIGPGSSPLTRGKRAQTRKRHTTHGLIPAHAGKTSSAPRLGVSPRAHPRSRGENPRSSNPTKARPGSSPLTRGKLLPLLSRIIDAGLIPAHAGKTSSNSPSSNSTRAHPRSRGENHTNAVGEPEAKGSSPLTRGKRRHLEGQALGNGLIPAHAGKTPFGGVGVAEREGSSPLTRGKRLVSDEEEIIERLIPAHAGKTVARNCCRPRTGAHPRSRGENH